VGKAIKFKQEGEKKGENKKGEWTCVGLLNVIKIL